MKNPENLNFEKDEYSRLEKALELNKPLATVYYMKEDLRQLWNMSSKSSAADFLQD